MPNKIVWLTKPSFWPDVHSGQRTGVPVATFNWEVLFTTLVSLVSPSQTALNMLARCMSLAFAEDGIMSIVLHPGWVQTDMGNSVVGDSFWNLILIYLDLALVHKWVPISKSYFQNILNLKKTTFFDTCNRMLYIFKPRAQSPSVQLFFFPTWQFNILYLFKVTEYSQSISGCFPGRGRFPLLCTNTTCLFPCLGAALALLQYWNIG